MKTKEIMAIWDADANGEKDLTLYVEREKSLNAELGVQDYWAFVGRYKHTNEDRKDLRDVLESLLKHNYHLAADPNAFVGTVAVFVS